MPLEGTRISRAPFTATVDGEDVLYGIKLQWLQMLGNGINWRQPESVMRQLPGAVVTDSKGLFDKLQTVVCTPKGKGKRIDVEAMPLKEGSVESGNKLLWVNGDAQLANSLTKAQEPQQYKVLVV